MKLKLIFFSVLFVILYFSFGSAEVPKMINYQGKLTRPQGGLINATVSMMFTIYDDSTGGTVLWTETQDSIVVERSIFSVLLGSVNEIPDSVFDGSVRYLGIKVGDDSEMTPRKAIVSVGYAYRSEYADTADYAQVAVSDGDWTIDGGNIYRLTGRVGIGTTNPIYQLHVSGVEATIIAEATSVQTAGVNIRSLGDGGLAWEWQTGNNASTLNGRLRLLAGNLEAITVLPNRNVGIWTSNPQHKLDVEGYVQAHGYYTGDIIFQKDKQKLWRMFEDEDGLYLENLKTGKCYRFVLQEVESEQVMGSMLDEKIERR